MSPISHCNNFYIDLDDEGVKTEATHTSSFFFCLSVDWQFILHLRPPQLKLAMTNIQADIKYNHVSKSLGLLDLTVCHI